MKTFSSRIPTFWFIMRVSFIHILLIAITMSFGLANELNGQVTLETKISIHASKKPIDKVLKDIEKQANVKFLYLSDVLDTNSAIDIKADNQRLDDLLGRLFKDRGINYEIDGEYIILTKSETTKNIKAVGLNGSEIKEQKVTGKILDENGEGIPGVTILIKDTNIGTTTDVNGDFTITANPEDFLLVSFIGYITKTLEVGNQTRFSIKLEPDIISLDELIVIGYGSQKKSDVIGSVSTVSAKDLSLQSVPNFDAALQGMASGVSVLSQSGKPGAPSSIKIRGANSISLGTEPLWVIDGMPIQVSPSGIGSSNQNPMSLINSNDIESINVLKDAAALAIYGSRGSNGVIIVTTKRGKTGQAYTSLNFTTGISQFSRTPQDVGYANTKQWFDIMDQATLNSTNKTYNINDTYRALPQANPDQVIGRDVIDVLKIDTDWFNQSFRQGSFKDLNVSSARGYDKGSFYFSANYRSDKGVLNYNQLDRFSARSNLSFEPMKNVMLDVNLNFSYTNNQRRDDDLTTITKFSLPWMPVYDPNNKLKYWNPQLGSNLVARNDPDNMFNNVKQYRTLANFGVTYSVPNINGLKLKGVLSTDIINSSVVNWRSKTINRIGVNTPSTAGSEENALYTSFNYNFYPSFDRSFGEHTVSVVAGIEATRETQYIRNMAAVNLIGRYQQLGEPGIGDVTVFRAGLQNERYILGYFGRANYSFKNRYRLGVSARRDGSSVFTSQNRWSQFYGFSAGWTLSEEDFMSFIGDNTYLKVRASYGEVGNQNIVGNLNSINYYNQTVYGTRQLASSGTVPTNLAVTNLKWETTRSFDLGLDFGLLADRINGTVGYYHRFVVDMLMQQQLPSSAGISPPTSIIPNSGDFRFLNQIDGGQSNRSWNNVGSMVNSGYEFELNTVNIDKNSLRWSTSFNISFNQNRIIELTPELDKSGVTTAYNISKAGKRRGLWYLADYAGVDSETGMPYIYALDQAHYVETGETVRLKDQNGADVKIYATLSNIPNNRFVQENKSSDPTYYGGLSNKVEFKGFDFNILFSFSGGNYILDYDRQVAVVPTPSRNLLSDVLENSWQKPGDVTKYPKLVRNGVYTLTDGTQISGFTDENVYHNRELYKGDFVRLRSLTIGYSLQQNILERLRLQACRVYISANNLLTWTKYPGFDPEGTLNQYGARLIEWNTPIPQLKTYNLGIDIKI